MNNLLKNKNFFKSKLSGDTSAQKPENTEANEDEIVMPEEHKVEIKPVKINPQITATLDNAYEVFNKEGYAKLSGSLKNIEKQAKSSKFSVAVVGEFNKGKSSFINKLLLRELLPVGTLPTTAMLTRIRYSPNEAIIFVDKNGNKVKTARPNLSAWENAVSDNFTGNNPEGFAVIGIDDKWLQDYNIEIMDTPGAADLEESRAKIIGDALIGCDAAIVAISATAPLSQSEALFIEERIIAKKTPYVMIIVTKLDEIKEDERTKVLDYIKGKLELWKSEKDGFADKEIPVYVPYQVDMPDDEYNDIIGIDKIKNQLVEWLCSSDRTRLTEQWLCSGATGLVDIALAGLNEQQMLYNEAEDKRMALISQKKAKLQEASIAWGNLKIEMLRRSNNCYEQMINKVNNETVRITEKLQYEASHSGSPQKWWEDDYPYRLKVELANLSLIVESTVKRIVTSDINWLNAALEKGFHDHVFFDYSGVAEQDDFVDNLSTKSIEFEDIEKQKTQMRIGTAVCSIAGFAIMTSIGVMPIIATMGIGTGGSIITEKIFKKKVEEQRELIKEAIAASVPEVISNAISESEKRVNEIYNDIIEESVKRQNEWLEAQTTVIENSTANVNEEAIIRLKEKIDSLNGIKAQLDGFLN